MSDDYREIFHRAYFGVDSAPPMSIVGEGSNNAPPTTAKKRMSQKRSILKDMEGWNGEGYRGEAYQSEYQRSLERNRYDEDHWRENRYEPKDNRASRSGHGAEQRRRSRSVSPGIRTPRMINPPEFPKDISSSGKLEAWLDWKKVFETSMELADLVSQRTKANYLTLLGGSELRQIITLRNMLPDIEDVEEDFPFYKKLVKSLESYFREMSDITIDVVAFMNASQEAKESARDFEVRLRRTAERCQNKIGEDMIKTRFIQGMKDHELAHQACIEAMDLSTLVTRATRQEAFGRAKVQKFNPWQASDSMSSEQPTLAVVSAHDRGKRLSYRQGSRQAPGRARPWAGGTERPKNSNLFPREGCKKCGYRTHHFGSCPANGRVCNKCKKAGHFERVCRAVVSVVGLESPKSDLKNESEEVNFYD